MVKNCNQIDVSLGGRLREKRTSTGWSQEELAENCKIDPKDVYAYETGSKRISDGYFVFLRSWGEANIFFRF